jgi:hypothetical protein
MGVLVVAVASSACAADVQVPRALSFEASASSSKHLGRTVPGQAIHAGQWCEGRPGDGAGEWLALKFARRIPAEAVKLWGTTIYPPPFGHDPNYIFGGMAVEVTAEGQLPRTISLGHDPLVVPLTGKPIRSITFRIVSSPREEYAGFWCLGMIKFVVNHEEFELAEGLDEHALAELPTAIERLRRCDARWLAARTRIPLRLCWFRYEFSWPSPTYPDAAQLISACTTGRMPRPEPGVIRRAFLGRPRSGAAVAKPGAERRESLLDAGLDGRSLGSRRCVRSSLALAQSRLVGQSKCLLRFGAPHPTPTSVSENCPLGQLGAAAKVMSI